MRRHRSGTGLHSSDPNESAELSPPPNAANRNNNNSMNSSSTQQQQNNNSNNSNAATPTTAMSNNSDHHNHHHQNISAIINNSNNTSAVTRGSELQEQQLGQQEDGAAADSSTTATSHGLMSLITTTTTDASGGGSNGNMNNNHSSGSFKSFVASKNVADENDEDAKRKAGTTTMAGTNLEQLHLKGGTSNSNNRKNKISSNQAITSNREMITFNCGGEIIPVQRRTIIDNFPNSYLAVYCRANIGSHVANGGDDDDEQEDDAAAVSASFSNFDTDDDGNIILDHDPRMFRAVLNFCRGYRTLGVSEDELRALMHEAMLWNLPELHTVVARHLEMSTGVPFTSLCIPPNGTFSSIGNENQNNSNGNNRAATTATTTGSFLPSSATSTTRAPVPTTTTGTATAGPCPIISPALRFARGPGINSDRTRIRNSFTVGVLGSPNDGGFPMTTGVHTLHLEVLRCDYLGFGLMQDPAGYAILPQDQEFHRMPGSVGYYYTGVFYSNCPTPHKEEKMAPFGAGSVLSMRLDMDDKWLEFFVNGRWERAQAVEVIGRARFAVVMKQDTAVRIISAERAGQLVAEKNRKAAAANNNSSSRVNDSSASNNNNASPTLPQQPPQRLQQNSGQRQQQQPTFSFDPENPLEAEEMQLLSPETVRLLHDIHRGRQMLAAGGGAATSASFSGGIIPVPQQQPQQQQQQHQDVYGHTAPRRTGRFRTRAPLTMAAIERLIEHWNQALQQGGDNGSNNATNINNIRMSAGRRAVIQRRISELEVQRRELDAALIAEQPLQLQQQQGEQEQTQNAEEQRQQDQAQTQEPVRRHRNNRNNNSDEAQQQRQRGQLDEDADGSVASSPASIGSRRSVDEQQALNNNNNSNNNLRQRPSHVLDTMDPIQAEAANAQIRLTNDAMAMVFGHLRDGSAGGGSIQRRSNSVSLQRGYSLPNNNNNNNNNSNLGIAAQMSSLRNAQHQQQQQRRSIGFGDEILETFTLSGTIGMPTTTMMTTESSHHFLNAGSSVSQQQQPRNSSGSNNNTFTSNSATNAPRLEQVELVSGGFGGGRRGAPILVSVPRPGSRSPAFLPPQSYTQQQQQQVGNSNNNSGIFFGNNSSANTSIMLPLGDSDGTSPQHESNNMNNEVNQQPFPRTPTTTTATTAANNHNSGGITFTRASALSRVRDRSSMMMADLLQQQQQLPQSQQPLAQSQQSQQQAPVNNTQMTQPTPLGTQQQYPPQFGAARNYLHQQQQHNQQQQQLIGNSTTISPSPEPSQMLRDQ